MKKLIFLILIFIVPGLIQATDYCSGTVNCYQYDPDVGCINRTPYDTQDCDLFNQGACIAPTCNNGCGVAPGGGCTWHEECGISVCGGGTHSCGATQRYVDLNDFGSTDCKPESGCYSSPSCGGPTPTPCPNCPTPTPGSGNASCDEDCVLGGNDCRPNLSCQQRGEKLDGTPNYVCWGSSCNPTPIPTPTSPPPGCTVSAENTVCINVPRQYEVSASNIYTTSVNLKYKLTGESWTVRPSGPPPQTENLALSPAGAYQLSCDARGPGGSCTGPNGACLQKNVQVVVTPQPPSLTLGATPQPTLAAYPGVYSYDVVLTWPTEPGMSDYVLTRCDNIGACGQSTVSTSPYTAYGEGCDYSFKLHGRNVCGTGPDSASVTLPACPPGPTPDARGWFQVEGGSVGAGGAVTDAIPNPPNPTPTWALRIPAPGGQEGLYVAPTPSNTIDIGPRRYVIDTYLPVTANFQKNYTWAKLSKRVLAARGDFAHCTDVEFDPTSLDSRCQDSSDGTYYYQVRDGYNLGQTGTGKTIDFGNAKVVLIGEGTVNINDGIKVGSGIFVLLAKNDIVVAPEIGLSGTANIDRDPDLEGIFYAGGQFSAGGTLALKIDGSVVGMTRVTLRNAYNPWAASGPITGIKFRPDFLTNFPDLLKTRKLRFGEVN